MGHNSSLIFAFVFIAKPNGENLPSLSIVSVYTRVQHVWLVKRKKIVFTDFFGTNLTCAVRSSQSLFCVSPKYNLVLICTKCIPCVRQINQCRVHTRGLDRNTSGSVFGMDFLRLSAVEEIWTKHDKIIKENANSAKILRNASIRHVCACVCYFADSVTWSSSYTVSSGISHTIPEDYHILRFFF